MFAPLDEKTLTISVLLLILMLIDTIIGVALAFKNNEFSTAKMREGIYHKATLIVIMLLGYICDTAMIHVPELNLPKLIMFSVCVVMFFMELASILENCVKMNPNLSDNAILKYFTSKVDNSRTE